jgi:hypothetical protein
MLAFLTRNELALAITHMSFCTLSLHYTLTILLEQLAW